MANDETPTATTEIDVDADPCDVWDTLSTDEGIAAWLGEGASIDPTPGGAIHAPDPVTGIEREGTVESIEPDHQLRYRWWPVTDPGSPSSVTIDVVPQETGTRIIVVERPEIPLTALVTASACASWAWRGAMFRVAVDLTIRA